MLNTSRFSVNLRHLLHAIVFTASDIFHVPNLIGDKKDLLLLLLTSHIIAYPIRAISINVHNQEFTKLELMIFGLIYNLKREVSEKLQVSFVYIFGYSMDRYSTQGTLTVYSMTISVKSMVQQY